MTTKVLVTGATGFVGSAVARRLAAEGMDVRVLVRPESDRRNLEGLPVRAVEGDLNDRDSLAYAVDDCAAVFHVAADYRLWAPDPEPMMRTNVEGTRAVLRAAQRVGVARIVYTSSVAVLGASDAGGGPLNESSVPTLGDMIGPYKKSKYVAEKVVMRLVHEEGLPVVVVNPSTPVGPRDVKPTPTGRLIVDAAAGHMPAYVDTGLNIVHVDDVAAGHLAAWRQGRVGERYILGGENLPLSRILADIAEICGRKPPRICLPYGVVLPIAYAAEAWTWVMGRLGGKEPFVTVDGVRMARKKMYFSSAKAEAELGYRARPAREALADAVAWFLENGYFR